MSDARLAALPGWSLTEDGEAIRREYVLEGFAEAADHHPDLHLTRYRRLEVRLTTHDAGGLTVKDFALAASIDLLI